jgi:hypothetical protein
MAGLNFLLELFSPFAITLCGPFEFMRSTILMVNVCVDFGRGQG